MHSMDFEEFLWAEGYTSTQIEDLYRHMLNVQPLSELELRVMMEKFKDYMILGGMPEVIEQFIENKNFSGTLKIQRQILKDYEEEDWLSDAGIINVCHCMNLPELPLRGNYNPDIFRVYFADTGLLIGSLDDEAQDDLRKNHNFNTYKGTIYENIVADTLKKAGYGLYFYKNEKSTVEMDFMVRDTDSLIPVEVKASDSATASLNNLIASEKYADIKYGIKFAAKNIGFNGEFYTFPYFLTFLLKRFLAEKAEGSK
ncbi:DUF4143 domain-containing protein [Candidatus Saccharibacteria bacterium]|nr:DUF4143 domain-containing protein [Candidatus Saccharibacteria bacterium]